MPFTGHDTLHTMGSTTRLSGTSISFTCLSKRLPTKLDYQADLDHLSKLNNLKEPLKNSTKIII